MPNVVDSMVSVRCPDSHHPSPPCRKDFLDVDIGELQKNLLYELQPLIHARENFLLYHCDRHCVSTGSRERDRDSKQEEVEGYAQLRAQPQQQQLQQRQEQPQEQKQQQQQQQQPPEHQQEQQQQPPQKQQKQQDRIIELFSLRSFECQNNDTVLNDDKSLYQRHHHLSSLLPPIPHSPHSLHPSLIPSSLTHTDFPPVSDYEYNLIRKQICRNPSGLLAIARSCPVTGSPQVLLISPVVGGRPFPTQLWLSDKRLCERISQLEERGTIKMLEGKIQLDEDLQRAVIQDNLRYIALRWRVMSGDMLRGLDNYKVAVESLKCRGIGGILNFTKVRCLHMQFAFHLIAGSTIGRMTEEMLEEMSRKSS
eukprot:GHVQ01034337.1.p1 GENE.GHVQ01034337.1~~GHVQ01034337.1.p1  ORF type:complete len:380 (+),score=82.18 GHVQ01034337.1:45-1142(+)